MVDRVALPFNTISPLDRNMYLPHEKEPTKFNDIHNYAGAYINEKVYVCYASMVMAKEEKKELGLGNLKMEGDKEVGKELLISKLQRLCK